MHQKRLPPVLVRAAKEEVRHRIREEGRTLPEDVAELLVVIEEKICDADFDVSLLKRICSPSPDTLWRFRSKLGLNPKAYLDTARAEIACRLVRESDAELGEIAECLGFGDADCFRKWFRRCVGSAPTSLRSSPISSPPVRPSLAGEEHRLSLRGWRRAVIGALGRERVVPVYRRLHSQQSASFSNDRIRGDGYEP